MIGCAVLVAATAFAQVAATPRPVFNGTLTVEPASGRLDRDGGAATLRLRRWRWLPNRASNGIFPGEEPLLIAIGERSYTLDAGQLRASRRGTQWSYRLSGKATAPSVTRLRLRRLSDGTYDVRMAVTGLDLERLNAEDPVCLPM